MKIGEMIPQNRSILLNEGKETKRLKVANTGDRPIQVGSHYHFFETNKLLLFDRGEAFGFRLDIPSGTSVRFEPGEVKEVGLVALGGKQMVCGFNDLTCSSVALEQAKKTALKRARAKGFISGEGQDEL